MDTIPSLPAKLSPSLTEREAITDALYRFLVGLDTNDKTLFESAFTPTASFTVNGRNAQGLSALHDNCFTPVSKLDTTHFTTNMRINIDTSGTKASMTCTGLSQHFRKGKGLQPEQPRLLAGSLYYLDFVKDSDGTWKIDDWKAQSTWAEGDWAVIQEVLTD
ncbi:hypothetical protein PHISCL_08808 [Aspergillus sclerotialis]|uniref:SnoaL-like domain-containing protein n=1 Tax=Aspergillus sclerotialis TaxID=2070753 RepID=A0A3A2Z6X0_9EURO|nr:hypothetical protein PHISCL_08808 [Aspergillus sclerotialis]